MLKNKSKDLGYLKITMLLMLFIVWASLAVSGKLEPFDLFVQTKIISLRCPVLNAIGVALEYVGHWPLPAAICLIMLGIKNTRFSYGIPMAACVLTSVSMYEILKHIFKRPRPDVSIWLCQEHGFSFPSGHTLNNMVIWIVLASLIGYYYINKGKSLPVYKKDRSTTVYPKKKGMAVFLRIIIIAWPVIIGLSRILVGVHWPSDVVGSTILALALVETGKQILFPQKHKTRN